MTYEGFSHQDLKDRLGSLRSELADLDKLRWEVIGEIVRIDEILKMGAPD